MSLNTQPKQCVVWTRVHCTLSKWVIHRLQNQAVQFEERCVDGGAWKWEQFRAASPNWSQLPVIQLPDGTMIKNVAEMDEWLADLGPYNEKDYPPGQRSRN
jgi:hypothetical protein